MRLCTTLDSFFMIRVGLCYVIGRGERAGVLYCSVLYCKSSMCRCELAFVV